jgi:acetyltransferase-like isoleucine patch superfamily enzyme
LILDLFRNRYRPALGSPNWVRYWGKRTFLIPELLASGWSQWRYRRGGARIGRRTVISPSTIGGKLERLSVGDDCAIGRVDIQLHAQVTIGNCVVINDGCKLLTGSHDIHSPGWELISHPIVVDDYAWISTNAIVLSGVTIGRGAVVGAGAVVTKSVNPLEVVAGNPARAIGQRSVAEFSYRPSESVALFEAWLGPQQLGQIQTHDR